MQVPHRILSPDESCGRALFGHVAFSSAALLDATWQALTSQRHIRGNVMSAAPPLLQLPELEWEQTAGWALLQSLCAHLEPSTVAKTGVAIPLLSP